MARVLQRCKGERAALACHDPQLIEVARTQALERTNRFNEAARQTEAKLLETQERIRKLEQLARQQRFKPDLLKPDGGQKSLRALRTSKSVPTMPGQA